MLVYKNLLLLIQKMFLISLIIFSLIALFSYFSMKRFLKNLIILPSECVLWFYWILFLIHSIKNCQNSWHDLCIQIYKCSYVFLKTSHHSYHRLENIRNQLIISNSFFVNGVFLHIFFFVKFIHIFYRYVNWSTK